MSKVEMPSIIQNVLSQADLDYLLESPEVQAAKEKLSVTSPSGAVYFKLPLTQPIRNALKERLGLDTTTSSEIPMRWIKGDTAPHIDSGASKFQNTYLVYLNNTPGELVLDTLPYPMTANTAYIFNEGIRHETLNTGLEPRLLLGPMNEFAEPVGSSVYYYSNYADAFAQNGNFIAQGTSWILGTINSGDLQGITLWRIAVIGGGPPPPSGAYPNGFDLTTIAGNASYYVYASTPCFLEGTKVHCQVDGVDTYKSIDTITPGTLVKTSLNGFQKVKLIGKGQIHNPGTTERTQDRLYKCIPSKYNELTEDLFITGCHSVLVDNLTDKQRKDTIDQVGKIFVTDKKYRLMACVDERAEPWTSKGDYTIWHLALEHTDERMNYGIYVNGGLLVETCSINFLKNHSNLKTL
jgi:hypothetical protein